MADIDWSMFVIRCPKCKTMGHILPNYPNLDKPNFLIVEKKGLIHLKCGGCGYEEIFDYNHRQRGWKGTAPAVHIVGEVDNTGKRIWRGGHRLHPI